MSGGSFSPCIALTALSTAIFVMGPDHGLRLAASRRGVEVFMVLKDGELVSTPNFPRVA